MDEEASTTWDEYSPRDYYRECINCNKTFSPGRRTQVYCSPECRLKYWKYNSQKVAIRIGRKGQVIGASINGVEIHPKAVQLIDTRYPNRVCPTCGESFEVRKGNKIYCSKKCGMAAHNLNKNTEETP